MRRDEAEHVLRAARAILSPRGDTRFIVIGSQSILGVHPNAPNELLLSMELDLYPMDLPPSDADIVDAVIGEGSSFHETFGYYADGVGPTTPKLPAGWRERLAPMGKDDEDWCLEPHDLAISKFVAGREKDMAFNAALIRHGLVQGSILLERLADTDCGDIPEEVVRARVVRCIRENAPKATPCPAPK